MIKNTQTDPQEELDVELKSVAHEKDSKFVKIYFSASGSVKNGTMEIYLLKERFVTSIKEPKIVFQPKTIFVEGISFYSRNTQQQVIKSTSKGLYYTTSFLSVLTLLNSYSSIFEVIKTFQMIEFLVFLNIEHPENLKNMLANLKFSLIDKLPNFFSTLKDDSCSIDKEKFVEEEVGCYILEDQGRYFESLILVLVFYLIVKIFSIFTQKVFLKENIVDKMNLVFWVEFVESIRLDLFISVFLSIGKLS